MPHRWTAETDTTIRLGMRLNLAMEVHSCFKDMHKALIVIHDANSTKGDPVCFLFRSFLDNC